MVDTNSNPDVIDVPIPANDDAIRAIKLIAGHNRYLHNRGAASAANHATKAAQTTRCSGLEGRRSIARWLRLPIFIKHRFYAKGAILDMAVTMDQN